MPRGRVPGGCQDCIDGLAVESSRADICTNQGGGVRVASSRAKAGFDHE